MDGSTTDITNNQCSDCQHHDPEDMLDPRCPECAGALAFMHMGKPGDVVYFCTDDTCGYIDSGD